MNLVFEEKHLVFEELTYRNKGFSAHSEEDKDEGEVAVKVRGARLFYKGQSLFLVLPINITVDTKIVFFEADVSITAKSSSFDAQKGENTEDILRRAAKLVRPTDFKKCVNDELNLFFSKTAASPAEYVEYWQG